MDYENFKWSLLEEIRGMTDSGTQVRLHRIRRENGQKTDAISLAEANSSFAPAIAVKPYYDRYSAGKDTVRNLAGKLILRHREAVRDASVRYGTMPSFEEVADRIYLRLVNAERSRDFLETIPHTDYLDLAAVFYVKLDLNRRYDAMILIHFEDLKEWHISVDDLRNTALRNTVIGKKAELIPMEELLGMPGEEKEDGVPLIHVLTNSERLYGAAAVLYPNLLDSIAEKVGDSFYILPSSVHEMLILPGDIGYDVSSLKELVTFVNTTEVQADEVLSNHVYRFEKGDTGMTIAL